MLVWKFRVYFDLIVSNIISQDGFDRNIMYNVIEEVLTRYSGDPGQFVI